MNHSAQASQASSSPGHRTSTDPPHLTEDLPVGGQAVIEGVMMRVEHRVVTAVRTPDRQIVVREEEHVPWGKRWRFLRLPVVRGAVSFLEMMILGMKTLNHSADVAMASEQPQTQDGREGGWKERLALTATLVASLAIGMGVFFFLPLAAAQATGSDQGALRFNLLAGAVRMLLLLLYLWAIGQWQEIRRVFQYHGAEHKSIFTLEAGADLTVAAARGFGRLHPRCGTSFLLIVVLLSILIFAVVDTAFVDLVGHRQSLLERFLTHLSVLPLISGLAFELLKLSGRKRNHPVTRLLIRPGLWLQRITTKEPQDDQLEVALVALHRALDRPSPLAFVHWHDWRRQPAPHAATATGEA